MTYDYDLIVIGAGSGGVRAARMSAGHGARVAWVHGCVFEASHGLVAGLNDGLKSFPFVLHVALDRFNQVGNQVVSSLQLDLDLREGVLKTVLQNV